MPIKVQANQDPKKIKPKTKKFYEITAEGTVPIVMKLRIFAEDEEQAYNIFNKYPHQVTLLGHKIDFKRLNKRKITIKDLQTNIINFVKNIF